MIFDYCKSTKNLFYFDFTQLFEYSTRMYVLCMHNIKSNFNQYMSTVNKIKNNQLPLALVGYINNQNANLGNSGGLLEVALLPWVQDLGIPGGFSGPWTVY